MEEKERGVHPDLDPLSGDTLRVWTSPVDTAAAKSASLSASSKTFAATWFIEKLDIWSRNKGLSWAIFEVADVNDGYSVCVGRPFVPG